MKAKKGKISWIEKANAKTFQIQADADVIVPDTKPDINKILQVDAYAKVTSSELQSDRVLISGIVKYNVIYIADDEAGKLHCMKAQTPFTDVVSFKGVNSDMKGDFEAEISSVNYRIINGRKFSVKSQVEICAEINKIIEIDRITDIEESDIQIKKEDVEYLARTSECEKIFVVNERLIIPQTEPSVEEVIKLTPKVSDYSVKVISNKVILKGELQIGCTYIDSAENNIISANNIVPFTEILDVDGIKAEDLCNAKVEVTDYNYNCEEDANGEIRSMEVQTEISARINALREEKVCVLCDCYAITSKLNVEKISAKLPVKIADVDYQDTFKAQISLNEDEPEIDRIYDVFSKVYIDEMEYVKGKLKVCGTVDNYVLYVTTNKTMPVYCVKKEIEFSESFDCDGNESVNGDFNARALNTSYVLNDNKNIELRVNVKMRGLIYSSAEKSVITGVTAEELAMRPDIASITVYFVQDNDTLWEIAKRYLTTVDAIMNINEMTDETLKTGMQLLIPKCKV